MANMSTFFGQSSMPNNGSNIQGSTSNGDQPSWFQNTKRRTIPNHLVPKKKPGFQISSSSTTKNSKKNYIATQNTNQFNLISFGNQQKKSVSQGGTLERPNVAGTLYDTTGDVTKYDETVNETINEDFSLYASNEDMPPSRSIYDLNDEILVSLNKPAQHADSFINKDPKSFQNVFSDRDIGQGETELQEVSKSINPLSNGQSAVLIFGYPESMSLQVIQHFKEFGNVLEDFESNKQKQTLLNSTAVNCKIVPIFGGESWIKITYDNPASALTALQENGTVFNGVLLGVIPYSKEAIEKLQKRRLTDSEDIGWGIKYSVGKNVTNKELDNDITPQSPTYNTKLDMKDGKGLFLSAEDKQNPNSSTSTNNDQEKMGVIGNVLKYVFGYNEL